MSTTDNEVRKEHLENGFTCRCDICYRARDAEIARSRKADRESLRKEIEEKKTEKYTWRTDKLLFPSLSERNAYTQALNDVLKILSEKL